MDLRLKGGTMTSRIFAYVVAMMVHCSWFVSVAAWILPPESSWTTKGRCSSSTRVMR